MGLGRNGNQPQVFKFMYQNSQRVLKLSQNGLTHKAALIYRNAVHSVVHLEMYLPSSVQIEESAFLLAIAPADRVVGACEQKLNSENVRS